MENLDANVPPPVEFVAVRMVLKEHQEHPVDEVNSIKLSVENGEPNELSPTPTVSRKSIFCYGDEVGRILKPKR